MRLGQSSADLYLYTMRVYNKVLESESVKQNFLNSIILLEQIRTLDKSRLRERMGRLDESTMSAVDNALSVSFGLHG